MFPMWTRQSDDRTPDAVTNIRRESKAIPAPLLAELRILIRISANGRVAERLGYVAPNTKNIYEYSTQLSREYTIIWARLDHIISAGKKRICTFYHRLNIASLTFEIQ